LLDHGIRGERRKGRFRRLTLSPRARLKKGTARLKKGTGQNGAKIREV
jgi:hypothetical protein